MEKNKNKTAEYPITVQQHHTFYWRSDLSVARIHEIEAWLSSLTPEQYKMFEDLKSDIRADAEYDMQSMCEWD